MRVDVNRISSNNCIFSGKFVTRIPKVVNLIDRDTFTNQSIELAAKAKLLSQSKFEEIDFSQFVSAQKDFNVTLRTQGSKSSEVIRACCYTHTTNLLSQYKKIFEESKNLTLNDSPILGDYSSGQVYDFPIKFAIACLNTFKRDGNAYITEKIPTLFTGMDKMELLKTIDKLTYFFAKQEPKNYIFNIENRCFMAQYIDEGIYGKVFKIQDILSEKPPVVIKTFRNPYEVSTHGLFSEIGMFRELTHAGVKNIPQFYMANPIGDCSLSPFFHQGGWMMTDFVSGPNTSIAAVIQKVGRKFPAKTSIQKFLDKKGLEHYDMFDINYIGSKVVDLGGITKKTLKDGKIMDLQSYHINYHLFSSVIKDVLKVMRKGENIEDIIKAMDNTLKQ